MVLIYANSEGLGETVKLEQVFSYNYIPILKSSDGSGGSLHRHRLAAVLGPNCLQSLSVYIGNPFFQIQIMTGRIQISIS